MSHEQKCRFDWQEARHICRAHEVYGRVPLCEVGLAALRARLTLAEQCTQQRGVQLAGCSVAALGGITRDKLVAEGSYAWSPAYRDVVELRTKVEAQERRIVELMTLNTTLINRHLDCCEGHHGYSRPYAKEGKSLGATEGGDHEMKSTPPHVSETWQEEE